MNRIHPPQTPITAYIEPTLRCNFRCVHCYLESDIPSESEELSTPEIFSAIDELASMGSLILVLTGGEITLRPDLLPIIRHARKQGFAVVLFTNGSLITKALAQDLAHEALLGVEVSLHSTDPKIHDQITGVVGSHEQVMAGIRNLRDHGIRVKLKSNLMRDNPQAYDAIIALAQSLGADYSFDPLIFPCRDHGTQPLDHRLEMNHLQTILDDKRLVKKTPLPGRTLLETPDARLCGAAENTICISSSGAVSPCIPMKMVAGNIRQQSLKSIWHESVILKQLREYRVNDLSDCTLCDRKKSCLRCSALAWNETGNPLSCVPSFREMAEIRKGLFCETP